MSKAPIYKPLEIEVTDFGPIAKAKIDLRPLTVFVGPSNTGKSYLATLIYALHKFFGGFWATAIGRHGRARRSDFFRLWSWRENGELSEDEVDLLLDWGSEIASRAGGHALPAGFGAILPDPVAALIRPRLRDIVGHCGGLKQDLARCFGREETATLVRFGGKKGSRILLKRQVSGAPYSAHPLTFQITINGDAVQLSPSILESTPISVVKDDSNYWDWEVFMEVVSRNSDSRSSDRSERHRRAAEIYSELAEVAGSSIISPLSGVAHYLPADRSAIMRTYRLLLAYLVQTLSLSSHESDEMLPALSSVLGDFLSHLVGFGDSPPISSKEERSLAQALETEILRGEVRQAQSATGYSTFSYQPAGSKKEVPLMQASSMVSELVPVVLYLRHLVRPGDVLIIEEPESHLHPAMQAAFTRQLAAVVRAGVRVMITTHSDYVLEELANLVRMSELPESQRVGLEGADFALDAQDVGVWLFEPRQRPKGTVVKEVKLDKDAGTFPAGYGDVTEALYNKWVEVDSRIQENKPNK